MSATDPSARLRGPCRPDRPRPRHGLRPGRRLRRRPRRPAARGEHLDQDRPRRGRGVRRERGVRRPRPRRRRVGLRLVARPDRRGGGPGRRRGRPDRPGERHGAARPDRASTTGRRPTAATRRRSRRTRSRSRSRPRSRDLLAADEAAARVKGIAFTESSYAAQREWKTFAATDGSLTEQVITHVGAGDRGQRRRRRRAPAPELPRFGRRLGGGGYEIVRGLGLRRARRAARRRGRRAADRAAVPVGPLHDHPRPDPALPPGPRVVRPPDRARPRLRDRGVVRRHELPDDRQARRGLPLRLGPRRHRGRRDGARRDGHVRLGRRGRRRAGRAARPERDLRRLPEQPRDGAADRAPERRRDAGRRLEPDPAHPDDQHQPAAQARDEPRRDRRRHRRRPLPRLEPVVVDRRPPAQLPVRDRGRLRDQGREEGPAVQEPDLHRDHLRVLALVRRGRRRVELRDARARRTAARASRARPATSATRCPGARFRDVQVGVGKW